MTNVAPLLKSIADSNRLRLLAAIDTHGELCACQLTELLGVTGATCSQHLARLVKTGLLSRRRAGRWMHFSRAVCEPEISAIVDPVLAAFCAGPAWADDQQRLTEILAVTPQTLCLSRRD